MPEGAGEPDVAEGGITRGRQLDPNRAAREGHQLQEALTHGKGIVVAGQRGPEKTDLGEHGRQGPRLREPEGGSGAQQEPSGVYERAARYRAHCIGIPPATEYKVVRGW